MSRLAPGSSLRNAFRFSQRGAVQLPRPPPFVRVSDLAERLVAGDRARGGADRFHRRARAASSGVGHHSPLSGEEELRNGSNRLGGLDPVSAASRQNICGSRRGHAVPGEHRRRLQAAECLRPAVPPRCAGASGPLGPAVAPAGGGGGGRARSGATQRGGGQRSRGRPRAFSGGGRAADAHHLVVRLVLRQNAARRDGVQDRGPAPLDGAQLLRRRDLDPRPQAGPGGHVQLAPRRPHTRGGGADAAVFDRPVGAPAEAPQPPIIPLLPPPRGGPSRVRAVLEDGSGRTDAQGQRVTEEGVVPAQDVRVPVGGGGAALPPLSIRGRCPAAIGCHLFTCVFVVVLFLFIFLFAADEILFKWEPSRSKLLREFWEDYALVMETLEENQVGNPSGCWLATSSSSQGRFFYLDCVLFFPFVDSRRPASS